MWLLLSNYPLDSIENTMNKKIYMIYSLIWLDSSQFESNRSFADQCKSSKRH